MDQWGICSPQSVPCSPQSVPPLPCPCASFPAPSCVPFVLISDCLGPSAGWTFPAVEPAPHSVGPDSAYVLITGCWRPQLAFMGLRNLWAGWDDSSQLILEDRNKSHHYWAPAMCQVLDQEGSLVAVTWLTIRGINTRRKHKVTQLGEVRAQVCTWLRVWLGVLEWRSLLPAAVLGRHLLSQPWSPHSGSPIFQGYTRPWKKRGWNLI